MHLSNLDGAGVVASSLARTADVFLFQKGVSDKSMVEQALT